MCDKHDELQRQLDMRNENTKVWIQADTQTRAYACKLERELESLTKLVKEHEKKLHSQWITCYYCGKGLHELKHMAEFKLSPMLDCMKCPRPVVIVKPRLNPFAAAIACAREVMNFLIKAMNKCTDNKLFRNLAAVYIVWQHDISQLETEHHSWDLQNPEGG